jgi:GNAT superfamily N-acetyltransferase
MVIDPPRPDERDQLVALAHATGFFSPEEVKVVGELLDEYLGQPSRHPHVAPGADEYRWEVYRPAPGAPPLGFICYGPVALSEDVYDLYWIAVDPAHQSQHIGSALLAHLEDRLRQWHARQLYIETSDTPQYAPTRAFYLRRGYEEAAHLTDYYHLGDGKFIYRQVFRDK